MSNLIQLKKEYAKEYYIKNKDKLKTYTKEYRYKQKETKPIRNMLKNARYSAKQRNIEFDLQLEDITIPTHCIYLGIELTNIVGKGKIDTNASLDRIDSTKGYIKGNVQVISYLANRMKSNATREQLISFAKGILNVESDPANKTITN